MSIELNTVSVAGEDGDDSEAIGAPARELQYAALYRPHTLTEVNAACAQMRFAMRHGAAARWSSDQ